MQPKPQRTTKDHCICASLFFVLIIVGLFAFQYYVTNSSPTITGAATADATEQLSEETTNTQIGVYRITPSFSLPDNKDVVAEYDILQKNIRDFYSAVKECTSNEDLETCIAWTIEKEEYGQWLEGEACETAEEKLFYDVTEAFSQCVESPDSDCICIASFENNGMYLEGEHSISLVQDETITSFSLGEFSVSIPNLQLYSQGAAMVSADYLFSVTSSSVLGSFAGLEPSSQLFLYKENENVISVEDQTTFSTYSATRSSCSLPEQIVRKFCVQSEKTVYVYSVEEGKTVEQPIVYMFAIDFQ